MDGIAKLSFVVSVIVLLGAASCARVSQKDQGPPPGGVRSTDGNAPSAAPSAVSSAPIPQPPAPNDVSTAAKTDSPRQSARRLSPRTSDYLWRGIDLNSGDLVRARAPADQPPRYDIYDTGLSREVRRLGIPIPEGRRWVRTTSWSDGRGAHFDMAFRRAFPMALDLLLLLEEVNASDEQRRDVLQRLMTTWQGDGGPYVIERITRRLIWEVGNPHGLDGPSVPVNARIEELRYLSSEDSIPIDE